ncbi:hypothetical protein BO70DRAFT_362613 [Aspergillus heteromorphus CBS 117.55]|uniref:Zn(2)-C6 fungal-type domain-containing protein n=1 Tax=Aspergillus heteromorphus CBS 117.55 TaxID=1448321 RepID=A0A317W513_9EURO|nr:uncharacterized protein BO70DRAFT_362613 [Aspergillus heteromorphus CBS 117.55]PWY80661.1 hypothetical protein BO70DRAFT_362613 [Aspergillus heteromorphus CBS 117.55]
MSATAFLDKPLLKVSRPVAACSRCRTAKIKCDGKLPACSACERVGKASTCSGATDEFARGKERSYVASLEGYCERLEKKIAELQSYKKKLSIDEKGVAQKGSIASMSSTGAVAQEGNKEVSDIDDLVGDFGFLSVNATSRDFHGITSNTSFANLLLSLSQAEPIPKLSAQPLPPRHEITPLLQHYFDNFYIQLPFFIETSFWTSVDAVYQAEGRFAKPFDHWILQMVLATASASVSLEVGDRSHQRALYYVSGAFKHAEDVICPGSIVGIQAILLLAQYSLFDPKHFRSWYLVGMASRAMVDLGLHQDPPVEVQSASEQLDLRRRVFHCIYCLDRGLSTVLERTFSLSDDSINVALPSSTTSLGSQLTEKSHIFLRSSEPAWHIVKVRQILSEAYQKKYFHEHETSLHPSASAWSLCSKTCKWFDDIPSNAPNYYPVMCRLELLYTTVMILALNDGQCAPSDYSSVVLFDCCMQYIGQLHEVLRNPAWLPLITFLDIERTFQVARRFLEAMTGNEDLLFSPSIPSLPAIPPETPKPLILSGEDQMNFYGRATECLSHIQDLLQYGARKWEAHGLFTEFQQISEPSRKRLMHSPGTYMSRPEVFMAGYPTLVPAGSGYLGFDLG